MNKEFVKYEQALALKELGFDEECLAWTLIDYPDFIISPITKYRTKKRRKTIVQIPLYQQSFRWFREKHNLHCFIQCPEEPIGREVHTYTKWCFSIFEINKKELFFSNEKYESYEEAESACLDKLIEIVKIL